MRVVRTSTIAAAAAFTLVLTACGNTADAPDEFEPDAPVDTESPEIDGDGAPAASGEVTVVTHDSFAVPDDVLEAFEASSGLDITFEAPGDAGALVNQLILTKDAPLG